MATPSKRTCTFYVPRTPCRIVLSIRDVYLYRNTSTGQIRLIPAARITGTLSTSTGQTNGSSVANCLDQDPMTSCTSGEPDEAPSVTINFDCPDTGTSLGTLAAVVVQMDPATNASEFDLVLKNRFGRVEQQIPFSRVQGKEVFTFQLNSSAVSGDDRVIPDSYIPAASHRCGTQCH